MFLLNKDDTLMNFEISCEMIQRDKGCYISAIRSDHVGELEDKNFNFFCNNQGYTHNFSSLRSL